MDGRIGVTLRFLKLFSWGPANRPPPPKALKHPVIFARPIRNSGGSRETEAKPLTVTTADAAEGRRPVITVMPLAKNPNVLKRLPESINIVDYPYKRSRVSKGAGD